MSFASVTDALIQVRRNSIAAAGDALFCFDPFNAIDASSAQRGDLFTQNDDFFIFEFIEGDNRRMGPAGPNHFTGGVSVSVVTKDISDEISIWQRRDEKAGFLAETVLDGICYREMVPVSSYRYRGFHVYPGTIRVVCEITPKR